jgi:hypothetical protein
MHFKSLPDGAARFSRFSEAMKKQADETQVFGADPILTDHASQEMLEGLAEILDRIMARLNNPQWQAI